MYPSLAGVASWCFWRAVCKTRLSLSQCRLFNQWHKGQCRHNGLRPPYIFSRACYSLPNLGKAGCCHRPSGIRSQLQGLPCQLISSPCGWASHKLSPLPGANHNVLLRHQIASKCCQCMLLPEARGPLFTRSSECNVLQSQVQRGSYR